MVRIPKRGGRGHRVSTRMPARVSVRAPLHLPARVPVSVVESEPDPPRVTGGPEYLNVNDLAPMTYAGQTSSAPWEYSIFDGTKFPGGFGPTQIFNVDYWTLRQRSSQLFMTNMYARGLVRRLVTNEINTGLTPEACPDENILGKPGGSLDDWTEETENRFLLWGRNELIVDWRQQLTFGGLQRAARLEALVSGDVLVVLRKEKGIATPMVQLVSGNSVRNPLLNKQKLVRGHKVRHGVELDKAGRTVAFWVQQEKGGFERIPAFGRKTGRRQSWLVYGTEKRLDDLRGQPLLAIVLQSLQEIDRYRDSVQRKAVINSILAMFIKKTEDKAGTLPASGGAVRKETVAVTDGDGSTRVRGAISQVPGVILEELNQGEEPHGFPSQGTDEKFGDFEAAVLRAVAWAQELPPEILLLSFSSNYSASQAATNEFKIYLNKVWAEFGEAFCAPIWTEWLLSETLAQKIEADTLLAAWRGLPQTADIFGAWVMADWYGSIKPSIDMVKQVRGAREAIAEGLTTRAREARGLTGTRFTKNVKRQTVENKLLVEAWRPVAEFKQKYGAAPGDDTNAAAISALEDFMDDYLEARGIENES